MKFIEFAGGIIMPTTNEEYALLEKISVKKLWPVIELDEREKTVAKNLVSRGMVSYTKKNNKTFIYVNDLQQRVK